MEVRLRFTDQQFRRFFWALFAADAAMVLMYVLPLPFRQINMLFDLDRGSSIPTWYISIQLLLLAILALVLGAVERGKPNHLSFSKPGWGVIAGSCALLSVDQVSRFHHRIEFLVNQWLYQGTTYRSVFQWWWFLVPAGIVAAVGAYWLFHRRLRGHRSAQISVIAGMTGFVAVVVFENLVQRVFAPRGLYTLQIALEEGTELFASTLLLLGFGLYLRRLLREGTSSLLTEEEDWVVPESQIE